MDINIPSLKQTVDDLIEQIIPKSPVEGDLMIAFIFISSFNYPDNCFAGIVLSHPPYEKTIPINFLHTKVVPLSCFCDALSSLKGSLYICFIGDSKHYQNIDKCPWLSKSKSALPNVSLGFTQLY